MQLLSFLCGLFYPWEVQVAHFRILFSVTDKNGRILIRHCFLPGKVLNLGIQKDERRQNLCQLQDMTLNQLKNIMTEGHFK